MKKYVIIALLCAIFIVQGCSSDAPGVYKNNNIDQSKHQRFSKLNAQLFEALKANKLNDAEVLMSQGILNNPTNLRTIELISLHSQSGYTMLDEVYILRGPKDTIKPLNTAALDGNKYTLFCPFTNRETYLAMMVTKQKGDKFLITAVFNNYNYGWKLTTLDFNPYTVGGKTAPQLSTDAMAKFNQGYLIDAYLDMLLANKCMRPNDFWLYPQADGMDQFYKKIVNVIGSYTYPLVIDQVATKPKIFEVTYQTNNEGIFPVIRYISSVNIKDAVALSKENDQIKKAIGKMFMGIDRDKKYIYFSAYNQLPKPDKEVPSFEMTDTLSH